MTNPVTIEDIYTLFQKSQEEADRRFAEMDRRFAEAERRVAEAKAEADRRVAEANQRAIEAKAEAERRAVEAKAEADRSMAELKKTVAETSRAVNALTTRWGRFVEELVEPAVIQLFQARGIDIKYLYPRARIRQPGRAMEIDILAVDETVAVLVECKSRLSQDDVDDFVAKLGRFKHSFPQYASYTTYGAVAGIEINEGVDSYAYRQGLFVIRPSGDTVAIVNDANFQPTPW